MAEIIIIDQESMGRKKKTENFRKSFKGENTDLLAYFGYSYGNVFLPYCFRF